MPAPTPRVRPAAKSSEGPRVGIVLCVLWLMKRTRVIETVIAANISGRGGGCQQKVEVTIGPK